MPVNKKRRGMPKWSSVAIKRPVPTKPGQYSEDGTANTGAIVPPDKPHDYEGPGKVVTPNS